MNFTETEKQIISLIVQGKTNYQIGLEMGISEAIVKQYVSKMLHKYNSPNRVSLIVQYLEQINVIGYAPFINI